MNTTTTSFAPTGSALVSEWIVVDHGIIDDKGRKIGGRADLQSTGIGTEVRVLIQSTRDGVAFGATRRPTRYRSPDVARKAAVAKLKLQRARVRAKWESDALTDEDGIDGPFARRMAVTP